jgi:hypothetical protein
MKFSTKLKLLIIVFVTLGIIAYYYMYSKIMQQESLDKILPKEMRDISLECWIREFIFNHSYELSGQMRNYGIKVTWFSNESLESNIDLLRKRLEEAFISKNVDVINFTIFSSKLNLIESLYAANKELILKNIENCQKTKWNLEKINILLVNSQLISHGATQMFFISSLAKKYYNKSDEFIENVKRIALESKNTLPSYEEVNLSKCYSTYTYIYLKDFERELRKQLDSANDPFSIWWKVVQIKTLDKCSKKLYEWYEDLEKKGIYCWSSLSETDATSFVINANAIFSFIYSSSQLEEEKTLEKELKENLGY